jgi:type IV pilus assembly protein PilV
MGTGTVCIDSTPEDGGSAAAPDCDGVGTQYTVKIWWDDNKDGVITVTPTNMERLEISFTP